MDGWISSDYYYEIAPRKNHCMLKQSIICKNKTTRTNNTKCTPP